MIQLVFWYVLMESDLRRLCCSEEGRNVVGVKAGEGGEWVGSGLQTAPAGSMAASQGEDRF